MFARNLLAALAALFVVSTAQAQVVNPGVQQHGAVTPGNCAVWYGTLQIQDGGKTCDAFSPVQSVFGRTGNVTAQTNDYSFPQISGQATNAQLQNPATTVNGQTCTLGSTCTVTAAPSGAAGGALSGTYPNPSLGSGAAALNVGSLGADLSGTLPNPVIAGGAITDAKVNSSGISSDKISYLAPFTNAVSRFLTSWLYGYVNLTDFGAIADSNGVHNSGTDNTSAFQNAVNYASAKGVNIRVTCPANATTAYRITNTITNTAANGITRIIGEGYCAKIYLDATTDVPALVVSPAGLCGASLLPCTYITQINFIAPNTATTSATVALNIGNSQNATIEKNWIDGYYIGALISTSYGARFDQNTVSNSKASALFNNALDGSFNAGSISKNNFFGNGVVSGDAAVSVGAMNGGTVISNNNCDGNAACFIAKGISSGVIYISNYMENSISFDFYLNGTNNAWIIQGNRIGSGLSTTLANLNSSVFSNNVIGGPGGTIQFDPATSQGNVMFGNVVEGGATFIANDGAGNSIWRNSGSSVLGAGEVVSALPFCNSALIGAHRYVTDAAAPTFLGVVVGGGSVKVPVFCNGTNWVSG